MPEGGFDVDSGTGRIILTGAVVQHAGAER